LEDRLAEIAVGNDQNPSLFPGDFKDILIGKTRRIVTRDGLNVMPEMAKVGNKDLQEGSCDKTQQADIASHKDTSSLGFSPTIISVFIFCIAALLHYTARPNALKSWVFGQLFPVLANLGNPPCFFKLASLNKR
jgi:hypothetical protein